MSNNEYILDIIAALNKQLSRAQLKKDLKGMDNSLSVKVIAKLATVLSKKQLKDSLKQLNNLYVQVGAKFKTDKNAKNELLKEIKQLQNNLTELQLKVGVEHGASQNVINSVISTAKTAQRYADKTSITLDIEVRKEKAVNDILYIGQRYSKLFSNVSASKKYENLLNSAYSISDKDQLQEVRAQIAAFTSDLKAHGLAVQSTGDKWRKLTERAKDLFSAASIVRMVFSQTKQAVSTTIDLDKVYTDLVKVNDELSRGDYAEYLGECNKKAQDLATSQKALIEGAEEFSKSNYNLATSNKLTEKATVLSNVGEMSASDSAKAIISGVQAYDAVDGYTDVTEKADALIDKYNEIGNTASITTAEIAQGVQTVGSVFADANTSVDEFIALLAAGNRQFQDADSLALGLRTSALRIRGCTAELEAMGEETDTVVTSTAKLEEKIKALTNVDGSGGVEILEADEKTFRSIYDIFADIGKVYKDMSDTDQSALLDLIAGKHRASAVSATLNNMTEAEEILQRSMNAAGSAQKEYDTYLESTEAHIQQFQAKLVETYSTFMNGDMISHVADLGTGILDLVNKTDLLKHSLVAIATVKIGQGITAVGGAIAGTVTQMNTLGNAIQQVKNLSVDDSLRVRALIDIGESTQSLTEKNLKLLLSQKQLGGEDRLLILQQHNLTEEEALAKLETMGLTTATNANTAANTANASSAKTLKGTFTGLAASIKATWAAMSMLQKVSIVTGVVSTLWSIVSSGINKFKQSQEELRQATEEAANAYKQSTSSISDYVSKYQELREALLAAKGNEEETYNVKKQLLDLQTELNDKFGDEYGKINLLTEAYKNQTEAIKELNKESADKFLNENRKGIESAENKLEADKTYHIGTMNGIVSSDELEILEKIKKMADENGIDFTDKGFQFVGNASEAKESIENFMNQLRELQKESGAVSDTMGGIFDGILDNSGEALSKAGKLFDEYGEIYNQAKLAQIVSDTELSETYDKAVTAVEAYNEAVLRSENPYSDENVRMAWQNLQTVRQGIRDNEEEWGQYSTVMDDVFAAANDDVYSFYQTLKDDKSLKKYADQLRGLSDTELQAMADDGDNGDAFDKLNEKAKKYGIEVQTLIDLLRELGVVQGNIQNSTSDTATVSVQSLPDEWESLKTTDNDELKNTREELLALAEAGRLTEETFHETTGADTFLDSINESLPETIKWINELVSSADQLSSMKKGISGISDALATKKSDKFVDTDTLSGFSVEIKGLESWEEFERLLGDSESSMEDCQKAANKLATEFINNSNFLSNLNDTNKDYYITQLDNMGIANAEEIVTAALTSKKIEEAAANEYATLASAHNADEKNINNQVTTDLTNATIEEITEIIKEGNVSEETANSIYRYALEKSNASNITIATAADCNNLYNLCSALGVAGNALKNYAYLKSVIESAQSWSDQAMADATIASAEAALKNIENSARQEIKDAENKVVNNKPGAKISSPGSGGSRSGSGGGKGGSGSAKETKTIIDWIERKLDILQKKIDATKAKFENLFSVKSKASNLGKQIKQTTALLKASEKAAKAYKKAADKVKLSKDLKKKVREGNYNIKDYDSKTSEQINKYKEYYDKYKDLQKQIDELKTQIRETTEEKYQLYVDQADAQLEKSQAHQALDEGNYKEQNKHLEKQKEYLEESYKYQIKIAQLNEDKVEESRLRAELEQKIRDLTKEEFDNIAKTYENIMGLIESQMDIIDSRIAQLEARGYVAGSTYYNLLISQESKNIKQLEEERKALQEKLNSGLKDGSIVKNTAAWYEMMDAINDVDNALIQAKTSLIEYQNQLRQIEWDMFDRTQDYISQIRNESDFLVEMMQNQKLFNGDTGQWTEYADATAGLHAVNYNSYMSQADDYAKEIQKINQELAKDPYNTILIKRKQELADAQMEAIRNAENEKQAIKDLVSDGYDAMLDALQKIIDKRKEMLDAEKNLYDYEKRIKNQAKEVLNLEKQKLSVSGDDSEEARAKLQQITLKLDEARDELQESEYEQWRNDQESMLDRLTDDMENWVNERLDNTDALVSEVISATNAGASNIHDTLEKVSGDVGYTLTSEMDSIWSEAGSVVAMYGDSFNEQLTNVNSILSDIRNFVSSMQKNSEWESVVNGGIDMEDIMNSSNHKTLANDKNSSNKETNTKNQNMFTGKVVISTSGAKDSEQGEKSSTGTSWGSWFVKKKYSGNKNSLNKNGSIIDRLKYFDFDSSLSKRGKYYKAMGGSGTYNSTSQQNQWMISEMKKHGFSHGGTIGKAINSSGEDGFVLARTGEEILSLEKINALKDTFVKIEPLIDTVRAKVDIPNIPRSEGVSQNFDNVNVDINLPNVKNYDEFKSELIKDRHFEKVIQSMTLGNALGRNSLNKFRI